MRRKHKTLSKTGKKAIAIGLSVAMVLSVSIMQAAAFEPEETDTEALLTEEMQETNEGSTEETTEKEDLEETKETVETAEENKEAAGAENGTQADTAASQTAEEEPAAPAVTATATIGDVGYTTLAKAVRAAKAGDTVCLHKDVKESVVIRTAITLDMQGHSITGNGDRAVYIYNTNAKVLNGTLKDSTAEYGAGIYISYSEAVLENVKVTGNTATNGYGGGIYARNSQVNISGGEISDHTSGGRGSGIALVNSSLEADNVKIENNQFVNNQYSSEIGGGIYVYDSTSTAKLKNCSLNGNKASQGGAIYGNGAVTLENCTVTGNETSYQGGAIYMNAEAELIDCTLARNKSASNGGAIYSTSTMSLKGSTLQKNTAGYRGGAIYATDAVILENCTINENEAANHGGGVFTNGIKVTAKKTTFTGNTANSNGGGIMLNGGSSSAELKDCNFVKNTALYGGGIGSYGALELENCTLSENTAESSGGGIFTSSSYGGGSVKVIGGKLISNEADRQGGGLYASGGIEIKDLEVTGNKASVGGGMYLSTYLGGNVENVVFTGNSAREAAAVCSRGISGYNDDPVVLKDCTFTKNTGEDTESIFVGGLKNILRSCTFTENNSPEGYIIDIYGSGTELFIEDCLLEKNTSKSATVHSSCSGADTGLELKNTVIRNNQAVGTEDKVTGGVSIEGKGYLRMISGAIYGNTSGANSGANDLFLSKDSTVAVIKADTMEDGEKSFAEYTWHDETNYLNEKEALTTDKTSDRYFTAGKYDDRIVARIGDETFKSLQAAVNAAKAGDKIVLIAGESDGNAALTTKSVRTTKDLTIDLNGHAVWIRGGSGIAAAAGELKIEGTGTVHGTLGAVEEGQLSVAEGVTAENVLVNGKAAYVDMKQDAVKLTLGAGKSVVLGENFAAETISVELDNTVLAQLNGGEFLEQNITLMTGIGSKDLLDKISVKGLKNPLAKLVQKDDKIEIEKKALQGVYLDGTKGSDSADGLSKAAPVKTFEKAKEILAAHEELDTIYIMGTVKISGTESWSLEKGQVMRYPEYTGNLISVPSGNSFTLSNITIDGAASYGLTDSKSLISLRGTMEIGKDAILQNNNVSKASGVDARGGAIMSDGKLTMNGGAIRNCSAEHGGGVFLYGDGEFIMNGGVMENNTVSGKVNSGQGGAVMITHNSKMIMNSGVLRGNRSEKSNGGAISVGGLAETNAYPLLEVNGGYIAENYAYNCGGGIYVECNSKAIINKGMKEDEVVQILNNRCDGKYGWFGGGGIYVNGGIEGYKNGVLYVYNVAVYNNTVEGMLGEYGASLAGCGTSNTTIYVTDGGVFYQNKSTDGIAEDILCSNVDHKTGINTPVLTPGSHISEYMLGGGAYHWKSANGEEITLSNVQKTGLHAMHTDLTAEDQEIKDAMTLAGVVITGNTSGTRGGGIGSNGDVIIGRPDDPKDLKDIKATKVWDDNDDQRKLRPEYIKIWLVRNGEKVAYEICRPDENGVWQEVTFKNQPIADKDGNPYEYTVLEDRAGLDYRYVSSVEEVAEVLVITNTYKPGIPIIPPDDPTPPPEIPDPDVPLGPGPGPEEPNPPTDIDEPSVPLAPGPVDDDPTTKTTPGTGDETPIAALAGLFGISVVALGIAIRQIKKQEK